MNLAQHIGYVPVLGGYVHFNKPVGYMFVDSINVYIGYEYVF
jgi:hypothetical protein